MSTKTIEVVGRGLGWQKLGLSWDHMFSIPTHPNQGCSKLLPQPLYLATSSLAACQLNPSYEWPPTHWCAVPVAAGGDKRQTHKQT